MRVIIQRVKKAKVIEEGQIKAQIGRGYLLFVALAKDDTAVDISLVVDKLAKLRLFEAPNKIHDFQKNIADPDIKGEILVIPNYTLYGDLTQGNRPFFGRAAQSAQAAELYQLFLLRLEEALPEEVKVKSATFGVLMQVEAVNFGPATLILETHQGHLLP